jgi:hypothetical protein
VQKISETNEKQVTQKCENLHHWRVEGIEEERNANKILVGKSQKKAYE